MKARMWTAVVSATVLSAGMPAAAVAQGACEINDSSPFQVNGAKQYVIAAAAAKRADEVPKHLRNAIRVLTDDPSKIKNDAGRQWMLVRAYAQWLQREDASYVMKRGDVGFTQNPAGSQNLLLALDSAATAVESMLPQCTDKVRPYREQFFGEILNKSIAAMGAEQNDSAAYFATLSLQVAGSDPRPWNVLSSVYQKQNKMDSAMIAMEKVIALSGSDTLYAKVKQQSRYNLAVMSLTRAEADAAGEKRDAEIKAARALLEAYLKDTPGDANAAQALGRAVRLSGDTAAVTAIFADMLNAPDKFTADQLFEAASNAAATGHDADASKLFENGLKKNPYHRVALTNYANVLLTLKDAARMAPVVTRLAEIDPNFDRAYRLIAALWQLRARAESDPTKKKAANDSVLFYLDRQTKTNPRVDMTLAQKSGNAYTVQGTVNNEGSVTASWTMKLELLDAAGAVVASKDVAIGPVDAGGNTTFSVKLEAPKAVAYRYAPLK
ncbi:tetratricopeptide repeat protein [Gemmatimonas sp.]|uniref:tetratricopeptide repeat protein n=1 Tax=Gemmatimonas sp. TaxID=1962908 RepID=UPI003983C625